MKGSFAVLESNITLKKLEMITKGKQKARIGG